MARKSYLLSALVVVVVFGLLGFFREPLDFGTVATRSQQQQELPPWKPGLLNIHHLHVGSSVSTFIITPDGTTILLDAGEVDVQKQRNWWKELGAPYDRLKAADPFPNASKRPSEWILDYIRYFYPHPKLDYLLLTHFHSDHFGGDSVQAPRASHGNYALSGIPAIANSMKIGKLIDRGYPDYNFPRDLSKAGDDDIDNYLRFVNSTSANISFEQFQVGSTQQIRQLHQPNNYPDFQIQVVRSSATVLLANGSTTTIPGTTLDEHRQWNENAMSAAFVIQYEDFRYYEGGDQEVTRNKYGTIVFDPIDPTAQVVGQVDVASLNHHGHGVTKEFVQYANPKVLILQGWCSDQPATKSIELLAAGTHSRQIFATYIFPERLEALGTLLSKLFASLEGHVVVRVHPPPPQGGQTYEMFVLDGDLQVKSYHGHHPVMRRKSLS